MSGKRVLICGISKTMPWIHSNQSNLCPTMSFWSKIRVQSGRSHFSLHISFCRQPRGSDHAEERMFIGRQSPLSDKSLSEDGRKMYRSMPGVPAILITVVLILRSCATDPPASFTAPRRTTASSSPARMRSISPLPATLQRISSSPAATPSSASSKKTKWSFQGLP